MRSIHLKFYIESYSVCVCQCSGKYVREFGSKADGKQASLFCPSRVAINRRANEVAVLEPKPSCQVRIFSADGRCVRKIGQQVSTCILEVILFLYGFCMTEYELRIRIRVV